MKVQAEISLYPLRIAHIGPPIKRFVEVLKRHDIRVSPGRMSTNIEGEDGEVFAALQDAFAAVGTKSQAVLTAKLSNACPNTTGER